MKKLLLLLLGAMATNFCWAQEIEWQKCLGGYNGDEGFSIIQTNDSGYAIAGYTYSNDGDVSGLHSGYSDAWIVKLDINSNIIWQKCLGGSSSEEAQSIIQTNDGGFAITGFAISNDFDVTGNHGGRDCWVVKIDSIGNIVWQKCLGGAGDDAGTSIIQSNDGNFIVTGYTNSSDSIIINHGNYDYFVAKLDNNGNVIWQECFGGSNEEKANSVVQTVDGGYAVAGYTWSTDGDIVGWHGAADYWIVKLDSVGNLQWQKCFGGGNTDYATSILQVADGNLTIAGYAGSCSAINYTGMWVVKIDSSGIVLWQQCYGNILANERAYSICATKDGGYGVVGWAYLNGGDVTGNQGNEDYWFIKIDSIGNLEWQRCLGSSGVEWGFSVIQNTRGNYVMAGTVQQSDGGDVLGYHGTWQREIWVVSLTEHYNLINGKTFLDFNTNSIQDTTELSLPNNKISVLNTNRFFYSNQNGVFNASVVDTGNFTITPTSINFYNIVPVTHTATFTGINQTDSLNDFVFQPAGVFNDLCVTITPLVNFRAGMNASYMVSYGNYGTTSLSGDIILFPDSNLTYVSSNTTPTIITFDSVVWSTGMLTPFQTGSIVVTINVNVVTPIGSLINSSVRIEPVTNDADSTNNFDTSSIITTGSIDPNDILVSEDTLTTTQLATQPFLDYLIRFQNTGNDTAFSVKVLNPIDTSEFELNSFEFVNSSHPVNLKWINYHLKMEFKFDNILLPDSNINEPASHGFVHYRIKPKTTLLAGDSVTNNAKIYFDFSLPVVTNTVVTHIVLPTTYASLAVSSCDSFLSPSGNYLWTSSGTYMDTIANYLGGDSIMTINLTVNYSSSSIINVSSCDSYTSPSGNYLWTLSGTYMDTIPNVTGCDSVITISLAITTLDTSVVYIFPSLVSNATGATYQWAYCDSVLIAGATSQSYTPTANSLYSVIISQNGCTDTSSCYPIFNTGISENIFKEVFVVFPNPAKDDISVSGYSLINGAAEIKVFDIMGKQIFSTHTATANFKLKTKNFVKGIYFIQAGAQRAKFVKQ